MAQFVLRVLGAWARLAIILAMFARLVTQMAMKRRPLGTLPSRKAMVAIVKRQLFTQRPKRFIQRRAVCLHIVTARAISCPCRPIVMNMVLAVSRQLEQLNFAMLWLVSYTWLLRLPSEVCVLVSMFAPVLLPQLCEQALPICVASPALSAAASKQTLIWREEDEICLRVLRRKNRPNGSGTLRRKCTCQGCIHTCVVHVLWDRFLNQLPEGAEPWLGITANEARSRLRRVLQRLLVTDAASFRTHDLRRGHAEDMRRCGCTLAEILRAGQWRSAAFLRYLDEVGGAISLRRGCVAHCLRLGRPGKGCGIRCSHPERRRRVY